MSLYTEQNEINKLYTELLAMGLKLTTNDRHKKNGTVCFTDTKYKNMKSHTWKGNSSDIRYTYNLKTGHVRRYNGTGDMPQRLNSCHTVKEWIQYPGTTGRWHAYRCYTMVHNELTALQMIKNAVCNYRGRPWVKKIETATDTQYQRKCPTGFKVMTCINGFNQTCIQTGKQYHVRYNDGNNTWTVYDIYTGSEIARNFNISCFPFHMSDWEKKIVVEKAPSIKHRLSNNDIKALMGRCDDKDCEDTYTPINKADLLDLLLEVLAYRKQ